jgi:ribosome-associated protein
MKTEALVDLVVDALDDLKAQDIRVLDVRNKTSITDVMVFATGTSNRQVKSLADHVMDKAKQAGVPPVGMEGIEQGEWALMDLGDVVVHIMQASVRSFYQLEKLWETDSSQDEEVGHSQG